MDASCIILDFFYVKLRILSMCYGYVLDGFFYV